MRPVTASKVVLKVRSDDFWDIDNVEIAKSKREKIQIFDGVFRVSLQLKFLQVMEFYSKGGLVTTAVRDCARGEREFLKGRVGSEY